MATDLTVLGFSLGAVVLFIVVAFVAAAILVPKSSWLEKYVYDALTHLTMEAGFVYMSITGTVATSKFWMAPLWVEYGNADTRWLHSDSCIVSVESITVWLDGPLVLIILYAVIQGFFAFLMKHFLQIILCTAELYGGWVTFCPEWLTDPLYHYLYLWFFNGLWVIVPLLLLVQSYAEIQKAFNAVSPKKKN